MSLSPVRLSPVRLALAATALLVLAGCNESSGGRYPARAYAPIPQDTLALFQQKNTDRNAPLLIRAYKRESEIEVWKRAHDGRYVHVKTYPICRWSGQLGPKKREGDRQVPEGFYTVGAAQMNPSSAYWLSFNVGYPNPMERQMGRGGGDIMVHGTCSSRGCFAMTNEGIEEIYAVMREALNGGQKAVQFQSYPFRMTAENLAKFRHDPNIGFWRNLKEGSDHFEVTKAEPRVGYCGGKYTFNASGSAPSCESLKVDPEVASLVREKQARDEQKVAELVASGTPAIRVAYADGGQHQSFRGTGLGNASSGEMVTAEATSPRALAKLGEISRPEAVNQVEEYAVNEKGERKAPKADAVAAAPQAAPAAAPAAAPLKTAVAPVQALAASPAPASGGALDAITSFFGSPKPAAPATTATVAAPAPASAPVVAAAPPQADTKPFFKRWLSLGSEEPSADAAQPAATPVPAKVPLPPRRQAAAEDAGRKIAMIASAAPQVGSNP